MYDEVYSTFLVPGTVQYLAYIHIQSVHDAPAATTFISDQVAPTQKSINNTNKQTFTHIHTDKKINK